MKCRPTQDILSQLGETTRTNPPECHSNEDVSLDHSFSNNESSLPTNKTKRTISNFNFAKLYTDMIRYSWLHLLSLSIVPQQRKVKSKTNKDDDHGDIAGNDNNNKMDYENMVVAGCIERMSDEDVIFCLDTRNLRVTDLVEKTKIWETAITSNLEDHDITGTETSEKCDDDSHNNHDAFK